MSRANPRFHRTNPSLPAVGSTNGVVLYRLFGTLENQMTINTWMYQAAVNAPTNAQLTTLLAAIHSNLFGPYVTCVSLDWNGQKETLDVVHRNDINGVVSTAPTGNSGTRPGGHVPSEVGIVILRKTAFKGQHGRGRLTLPATSTADVAASSLSGATIQTNLGNLQVGMLATASDGTNTWTPCIGQRSNVSPRLIVAAAPIVLITHSNLLGTIRRRKIGRGK